MRYGKACHTVSKQHTFGFCQLMTDVWTALRAQVDSGHNCWWRDPEIYSPSTQAELDRLARQAMVYAETHGFAIASIAFPRRPVAVSLGPIHDLMSCSQAARNLGTNRAAVCLAVKRGTLADHQSPDAAVHSPQVSLAEARVWFATYHTGRKH